MYLRGFDPEGYKKEKFKIYSMMFAFTMAAIFLSLLFKETEVLNANGKIIKVNAIEGKYVIQYRYYVGNKLYNAEQEISASKGEKFRFSQIENCNVDVFYDILKPQKSTINVDSICKG